MLWHRWFLSVKGKGISESSKQEGIVLAWNFSVISALQWGSCKCKRYQRLTCEKVGRGAVERWQWKLFGGHNNRLCYCKAWGFSYLLLYDNSLYFIYLLLYGPLIYKAFPSKEIYSCSGFAASFPAGDVFSPIQLFT